MICLSPGTSDKTARQIYRIDFQPTLIHAPNQNVVPSERHACSLVEGIASTAVTKLYQLVASVQLEPKVAILKCGDFRWPSASLEYCIWGNHAMILRKPKRVFTEVFQVAPSFSKRNMHPMSSSLATHRSFRQRWAAGKQPASAVPNVGIAWYHCITRHISSVLLTLEANLDITDTRRKKNTLLHVNLTQQQPFEWW